MYHSAETAPEESVDELTGTFPPEVRVVQGVVCVQLVEILGQVFGGRKVVHMDVGMHGGDLRVVLRTGAHHYRKNVVGEAVDV